MSPPSLELRVRELERKLASVTQERDDLLKDVEALAISNGSSMFSGSYVLSERVSAVDQELKEARGLISRLTSDNEGFMQQLASIKIAKLAADTLGAQQGARLEGFEKDLAYYQARPCMAAWRMALLGHMVHGCMAHGTRAHDCMAHGRHCIRAHGNLSF